MKNFSTRRPCDPIREWLGTPEAEYRFHRPQGALERTHDVKVLVFQRPSPEEGTSAPERHRLLVTATSFRRPRAELCLGVSGQVVGEDQERLARALAELAVLPEQSLPELAPRQLHDAQLWPVFHGMERALVEDAGPFEQRWLPGPDPIRMLVVQPLYGAEADYLATCPSEIAYREFLGQEVDWHDPRRPALPVPS